MSEAGIPHDARPLRRQKLSETLAQRLLGWIEDGMLPPGADLPSERGLMLKLGVGRSTVREAVAQLERMGVVSVGQGARARVTLPTTTALVAALDGPVRHLLAEWPGGLDALKDARLETEAAVVRLAARRWQAEHLEKLRDSVAELTRLAARVAEKGAARMDAFMAEDQRFHGLLGDATGNAVLAGMVQGQGQFLARHHVYRRTAPEALARNTEATVAEHAAILRALARRHADDAEAALRAHLGRAHAMYQRRPRRAAPDNSASPA